MEWMKPNYLISVYQKTLEITKTTSSRTTSGELNFTSHQSLLFVRLFEVENGTVFGKPKDIWALGCTFYQMIYGCTPFDKGLDVAGTTEGIINEP